MKEKPQWLIAEEERISQSILSGEYKIVEGVGAPWAEPAVRTPQRSVSLSMIDAVKFAKPGTKQRNRAGQLSEIVSTLLDLPEYKDDPVGLINRVGKIPSNIDDVIEEALIYMGPYLDEYPADQPFNARQVLNQAKQKFEQLRDRPMTPEEQILTVVRTKIGNETDTTELYSRAARYVYRKGDSPWKLEFVLEQFEGTKTEVIETLEDLAPNLVPAAKKAFETARENIAQKAALGSA